MPISVIYSLTYCLPMKKGQRIGISVEAGHTVLSEISDRFLTQKSWEILLFFYISRSYDVYKIKYGWKIFLAAVFNEVAAGFSASSLNCLEQLFRYSYAGSSRNSWHNFGLLEGGRVMPTVCFCV